MVNGDLVDESTLKKFRIFVGRIRGENVVVSVLRNDGTKVLLRVLSSTTEVRLRTSSSFFRIKSVLPLLPNFGRSLFSPESLSSSELNLFDEFLFRVMGVVSTLFFLFRKPLCSWRNLLNLALSLSLNDSSAECLSSSIDFSSSSSSSLFFPSLLSCSNFVSVSLMPASPSSSWKTRNA